MLDQLHCPMSYAVYKFQPELCSFTACCDATLYDLDLEAFDTLGDDYFEKFPKLIQRKKDLYANIKNSDCIQCWQKEAQGLPSMRTFLAHHDFPSLCRDRTLDVETAYPRRIELWMKSTCNLGCFMCHTGNSNTLRKIWWKDHDVHGNDGRGYEQYANRIHTLRKGIVDEFKARVLKFTLKAIRNISNKTLNLAYLGGEPTLHNDMYEHADLFIEAGRPAISNGNERTIDIVTNGTSKDKLNERFYSMYEKYKSAGWQTKIMLSQDGANDAAQIRWGRLIFHKSNTILVYGCLMIALLMKYVLLLW